jgi:outer membrane lipoprotein carrier protein
VRVTFILLIALLSSILPSASGEDRLLEQFESRYSTAHTLQATFLERYLENGKVVRVEAGEAYFLRPGKMRWDYATPEKNTFLVDGKFVWFYSPADHTVTRMPAKKSEDWRTPLAFLTSHIKLSRLCSSVEPATESMPAVAGNSVYRCIFHETAGGASSAARSVLFELSKEGELARIVIPQEGAIELEFSFKAWRWNPVLDKTVFEFVPSRDTVVVEGLLPDTPGLRQ